MKILLVAINASYMHTSLSVRSIYNYVINQKNFDNQKNQIKFIEFTINQPVMQILHEIASYNPNLILFSSYIWNAQVLENVLIDIKKVLPYSFIGVGGPEFSYAPEKYLKKLLSLDFIIFSEGEQIVSELIENFCSFNFSTDIKNQKTFFKDIKGLYFLDQNSSIKFTGYHQLIENLNIINFPYPELENINSIDKNKIYYYESSRGCPYSCSYCLSSVDKRVRFKSVEKVFSELQIFLDANVKLVKFVDRTYNINPERYIKIWKYILSHHNKNTMFHFEIEAEYLSEEALEFLQTVPEGIMQFEIGVQSANQKTLSAINRSCNVKKLAENIKRIPRTIHQHLDLIAGLPYEDLESFGKSFDFVMSLKPDALQLGFLKVLNGTSMYDYAIENNWAWQENSVYEVFSTPYLSFAEIKFLKNIEILVDEYWNKKLFCNLLRYVFKNFTPWSFFAELCNFAQDKKTFDAQHKDLYYFELLNDFFIFLCNKQRIGDIQLLLLQNLLRYDFVSTGKKGNFPSWYIHRYDKQKHRELLEKKGMLHSTRLAFALTEFEIFDFDVTKENPENYKIQTELLIIYSERN